MSSFNHPAILKFIGYSPTDFESQFFPTIVMELCANKSLNDVIQLENKGSSLKGWDDTKKLINIYGIACGMKYLHQQGILHRDLKTLNILMDEFLCPKIADFGMSKLTKNSAKQSMNMQSSLHRKGTPPYMAPEIWSNIEYSSKGDVYAFSFILYEMLIGENPFISMEWEQVIINVLNGNRPNIPENVPEHYKSLIQRCWAQDPNDRPSFESIVDEPKTDRSYITDLIDESIYKDYIDFLDNYQSSFDICKKHISFEDFVNGKHGNTTLERVNINDS